MLIFRKYVKFFAVQEKKNQNQKTNLICGVS